MRLEVGKEWLDDDRGTREEIGRSLSDLAWLNRHFGAARTWPRLLERALAGRRAAGGALTLLDAGAGTGHLTAALAAWLRARGFAVTAIALDRRGSHLAAAPEAARGGDVERLAADALHPPFGDDSVDLVTANLFLHHFHDRAGAPAASALLGGLYRVARVALIVNDLERAWPAYAFTRAVLPRLRIHGQRLSPLTLHDAPLSVRQAYTRRELEALAGRAGLRRTETTRLWPFRLGLIAWKEGAQ